MEQEHTLMAQAIDPHLRYERVPSDHFDLYGVFYDEASGRFLRMDPEVASNVSDNVARLNANTAGGRVRFRTNSKKISMYVRYDALESMPHASVMGLSGFTLMRKTATKDLYVYSFMPGYYGNEREYRDEHGFCATRTVTEVAALQDYILYFPNYNDVRELWIGFEPDALFGTPSKYRDLRPVLFYGSSITQGACASRPDNSYPALVCKWGNVDFINLGFSGSALGEDAMAEYLASVDCSVFVSEYDYNAPNVSHLEKTHMKLYRTFRAAKPETPIVLMSRVCPLIGQLPAAANLAVVRNTFETARQSGDANVYFVNGSKAFPIDEREHCFVDGTHPNDLGFYRMARNMYPAFRTALASAARRAERNDFWSRLFDIRAEGKPKAEQPEKEKPEEEK